MPITSWFICQLNIKISSSLMSVVWHGLHMSAIWHFSVLSHLAFSVLSLISTPVILIFTVSAPMNFTKLFPLHPSRTFNIESLCLSLHLSHDQSSVIICISINYHHSLPQARIVPNYQSCSLVGSVDLTLVGWILLFLCRNLDHTMQNGGNGDDDKNARKDKDNGR